MIGFAAFIVILVAGILVLVGGLQWISGQRGEPLPPVDHARLDRMESALAALESRLDELHDQQRFLERLLEDRPEPRALEPGADTEVSGDDVDSILFDRAEEAEDPDR